MVGEDDLRLCLGLRATAGMHPSVFNSGDQLPLCPADGGDHIYTPGDLSSYPTCIVGLPEGVIGTAGTQGKSRGSGNGEEKGTPGKDSDEEDGRGVESSGTGRKKLRLSNPQASILENAFRLHHTLNPKQKLALARELNLRPRQVEVWFQNRRARTKLKKTEVDCELLKRCCKSLTEENRRLQRELLELRRLKRPPPNVHMQMGGLPPTPPTTVLAICPTCKWTAPSTEGAAPPAESRFKHHPASLPLQRPRILLS